MLSIFLIFLLGVGYCSCQATDAQDIPMTEHLKKLNYSFENHTTTTKDGYILTLGRIPVNLNKTCDKVRGTVMLQHGMFNNGMLFLYLGVNDSLGFQLSNKCYDVWIVNTRGTRYSSRHVNMTDKDRAYWNYSFDELAKYDLSAMIDYITNATGRAKIHFIGYSQAPTQMLMLLSKFPQYNNHIESLHLLAPIVYFDDYKFYPPNLPVQALYTITKVSSEIFGRPTPDKDYLFHDVMSKVCEEDEGHLLCSIVLMGELILKEENHKKNLRWALNFPERISMKTMAQFAQFFISGNFQMYDYGSEENMKRYGQKKPPLYELGEIKAPIHIYHAKGDLFCTEAAMERVIKQLPKLRLDHFISDPTWGHPNFVQPSEKSERQFLQHLYDALGQFDK